MDRRTFLMTGSALSLVAGFGIKKAKAFVPAHNWDGYNFGCGPTVMNRLNQGPFPIYPPEEVVPGSDVVMTTTPSERRLKNYGMGLVTYVGDEAGPPRHESKSLRELLEELVTMPLADVLYIRLDWKDLQQEPGKLNLNEHWKLTFELAEKYQKRVGFRVQLMNPVIPGHAMPDFVSEKVPVVKLGKTNRIGYPGKDHYAPRYDHPFFMSALKEFDYMLATEYNAHPLIEYVDTYMYGFWGEGHTWPFQGNPFPDYRTAEQTFIEIFEYQRKNWSKIPLTTNTQPDFSRVGNSEILDRTVRTHNWLRTDTIFIENMQIEALSNRPPWIGATIEKGMSDGSAESLRIVEGVTETDNVIAHVKDIGANYWSLWNWHRIRADRVMNYYEQYPEAIDNLARNLGYRVRPSWIWQFQDGQREGLVFGMVNDGIAGVPGVLWLTLIDERGNVLCTGGLDPGYPIPGKVRQARMDLPPNVHWEGLKLKAEIEVKGRCFPVEWACHQAINEDGTLTLRRNLR